MDGKFYIITRFNAPVFNRRARLMENNLNDDWLKARLELFLRYCYLSVINQSWQNFTWLLWCHPDSPQWLRDEFNKLKHTMVVYSECCKPHIEPTEILITTRLDSDDMLHQEFMQAVSNHLPTFVDNGKTREVYSFKTGYQYNINDGPRGTLWKVYQPDAPFLTLFADVRKDITDSIVYCEHHGELCKTFAAEYNHHLPAWMWVQHDNNICGTALKKLGLADITSTLKQFGVNP